MDGKNSIVLGLALGLIGLIMIIGVLINGFPFWFTNTQRWNWIALSAGLTHCIFAVPIINKMMK